MSESVRREDSDGVITVTFTRDEKLNAIDRQMFDALRQAVYDLEHLDDMRVLVIRAQGRYFTAGIDISTMSTNFGEGTDGVVRGSTARSQYRIEAHHDLYDEMEQVEKPIVLAAHSHCWGAGVEFGASCDFRFASDQSTFALPEVRNLAVLPGSGGISRLTRIVGPHWARWLVMAGETIDADTALNMGYVHAVYPIAEFDSKVDAFVSRLAGYPREAMGIAKIAIDAVVGADRRTTRQFDRLAQTALFNSPEYLDKVKGFVGRKKG